MTFNFLSNLEPKDDATIDAYEREEREIEIKNNLFHFMPYGSESQTFDTFNAITDKETNFLNKAKEYAMDIVNNKFKSLALIGGCGIGKTHIALAIMRYIMENGINTRVYNYVENGENKTETFKYCKIAKYYLIPQLCERYTNAMGFNTKETQVDIIKEVTNTNLVVLDELGRGVRYESELLYRIINECWIKKIPMILISNLENREFFNLLGNASIDRLKDSVIKPDISGIESHRGFNF